MHEAKFKAALHEKLKREVMRAACVTFFQLASLYPVSGVLFLFYCVTLKTIYCNVASFAAVYWVEELPDNSNTQEKK